MRVVSNLVITYNLTASKADDICTKLHQGTAKHRPGTVAAALYETLADRSGSNATHDADGISGLVQQSRALSTSWRAHIMSPHQVPATLCGKPPECAAVEKSLSLTLGMREMQKAPYAV